MQSTIRPVQRAAVPIATILAMLLTLAACGGGSSGSSAPPATPVQPAPVPVPVPPAPVVPPVAAPMAVIGVLDKAALEATTSSARYRGLALDPAGALLLNRTEQTSVLQKLSGTSVTTLGTVATASVLPQCLESRSMVADRAGNLYLACGTAVVRVSPAGAASVIAGRVGSAGNVDGKGDAARFKRAAVLAIGNDGVLYVGDDETNQLRKIGLDGTVTTLAGSPANGTFTGTTVDGAGAAARFALVGALAVDTANNIYVSDYSTIRKVTPAGVVSTVAGVPGKLGYRDGPAREANFGSSQGLAFDSAGNLFIADTLSHAIRKLDTSGQVSTFAGDVSRAPGYVVDGTGTRAQFGVLLQLVIDSADNIYVNDSGWAIRRITPGAVVTTPVALPVSELSAGFVDGPATVARFSAPTGLAADTAGNLLVIDSANGALRKVSSTGVVSTVIRDFSGNLGVSTPVHISAGPNGSVYTVGSSVIKINADGSRTTLSVPTLNDWIKFGTLIVPTHVVIADVVADRNGNYYMLVVEDTLSACSTPSTCFGEVRSTLHKVASDGTVRNWYTADLPAFVDESLQPGTMTMDADGNLYAAVAQGIAKLTPGGVWSLLSVPNTSYAKLTTDAKGNLYVLDARTPSTVNFTRSGGYAAIRKITPDGKITSLTDSLPAPLYASSGIAVDADNRVWVTQGNAVVQIANP
jgi:sugar lactone lactonase YvrE